MSREDSLVGECDQGRDTLPGAKGGLHRQYVRDGNRLDPESRSRRRGAGADVLELCHSVRSEDTQLLLGPGRGGESECSG